MLEEEIVQDTAREAAIENRRMKKKASDKIRTSAIYKKKRESDAREAAAKNKSDAREAAINNRIISIADKIITASINKKKQESDAREAAAKNKKKQDGKKKKDDTQYEIEAIVGHDLGGESKKVVRLRIRWVGYAQTTMESVKATKETVWEMVDEYAF